MAVAPPELPRYSEDRKAYQRAWMKRKRMLDRDFAKRQSDSTRRWQRAHPIQAAILQYRNAARRRGLAWEIGDEIVERLVTASCHYCGVEPNPINGVDRVDSALGYTSDNVVTACMFCNLAKRDRPLGEFEAWLDRIANFRKRA